MDTSYNFYISMLIVLCLFIVQYFLKWNVLLILTAISFVMYINTYRNKNKII